MLSSLLFNGIVFKIGSQYIVLAGLELCIDQAGLKISYFCLVTKSVLYTLFSRMRICKRLLLNK